MMPGMLQILLLLSAVACHANRSIFLLGDSVSQRIVQGGFIPLFNCTKADPKVSFKAETSDSYKSDTGLLCYANNVTRVGYTIHFGVFDSAYHERWNSHKAYGSTDNSRTNVIKAVKEFQHRTEGTDDSVLFMFHSAAWDSLRFKEHGSKLYKSYDDWLDHYQDQYTSLMIEIRQLLRKQDQLVISTMHEMKSNEVLPLNERAKRVASYLRIPVFDQAKLLGPKMDDYLIDTGHQSPAASLVIAQSILDNNFVIIPNHYR